MSVKEMVTGAIQRLPEDATIEDIRREIEFIAGVRQGLEQLDRGEGVPLEEVEKQLPKWLSK